MSAPSRHVVFGRVLSACLLALACTVPARAEPLGRLFLTPERRALLDRQRQTNVQQQVESVEGSSMSLDGIVTHSTGKRTVWVNGHPQGESEAGLGVNVRHGRAPGEATLSAGEEAPVSLKVGESVNWGTREKQDSLHGGRIVVKPARPLQPAPAR